MNGEGAPDSQTPPPPQKGGWIDALAWLGMLILVVGATIGALWAIWTLGGAALDLKLPAFDEPVEVVERRLVPPPDPPETEGTDRSDGVVVTRPRWITPPRPEFPRGRTEIGDGAVTLRCEVLASGVLGACEVVSETPQGHGFAEAALASTRDARLQPNTIDGVATDGTVQFTTRFALR